jgi:hypothetical protein
VARAGELVTHELATVAVSEGLLPFDDDALRSFGLTPGGSLQREGGGWLLVSFPRRRTTRMVDAGTEGHLKGEVPWESGAIPEEPAWITVLDQAGIVIGAGELRYGEQDAAAHIAVDGEPVKVGIGRHPFRRGVGWRSPYDDVAAADRLTKVAHWAAHTERPSLALRCFEEAVVAWLDLGDVFRAAWAWHRADHARLELELDQIDPGLVAALRAVISTGDVPDTDFGSDRIGAWAWAADLDLLRERR